MPLSNMNKQIYLIVADDTEEFNNALRYACKSATANNRHVGVLYVIADDEFQHWGNLEERMKQERRQEADKLLQKVADRIKELCGITPSLYIGEGNPQEAIIKTIADDPNISNLFLGGSTKSGGPGPLVSYFLGKGITKLPVPLTVIPDHIDPDRQSQS
jgi:nucleotide-binding universal stress UspA family protein